MREHSQWKRGTRETWLNVEMFTSNLIDHIQEWTHALTGQIPFNHCHILRKKHGVRWKERGTHTHTHTFGIAIFQLAFSHSSRISSTSSAVFLWACLCPFCGSLASWVEMYRAKWVFSFSFASSSACLPTSAERMPRAMSSVFACFCFRWKRGASLLPCFFVAEVDCSWVRGGTTFTPGVDGVLGGDSDSVLWTWWPGCWTCCKSWLRSSAPRLCGSWDSCASPRSISLSLFSFWIRWKKDECGTYI